MNKSDTVFVLGSGSSLLNLTNKEKEYLNSQTTIAMNKYLIFWEKIGVFPKYYFLGDIHFPAIKVFEESYKIIKNASRPIHCLLDESYNLAYFNSLGQDLNFFQWTKKNIKRQTILAFRDRYFYNPFVNIENVTFFKRHHRHNSPLAWADRLDDRMFFYRGSLSVLLNLISVLNMGRQIKLLGVDLTAKNFFDEEIKARPDLWDKWMRQQSGDSRNLHATALSRDGQGGIHTQWKFISLKLGERGFNVFCCNPDSLLVRENLCEYAPILDSFNLSL